MTVKDEGHTRRQRRRSSDECCGSERSVPLVLGVRRGLPVPVARLSGSASDDERIEPYRSQRLDFVFLRFGRELRQLRPVPLRVLRVTENSGDSRFVRAERWAAGQQLERRAIPAADRHVPPQLHQSTQDEPPSGRFQGVLRCRKRAAERLLMTGRSRPAPTAVRRSATPLAVLNPRSALRSVLHADSPSRRPRTRNRRLLRRRCRGCARQPLRRAMPLRTHRAYRG